MWPFKKKLVEESVVPSNLAAEKLSQVNPLITARTHLRLMERYLLMAQGSEEPRLSELMAIVMERRSRCAALGVIVDPTLEAVAEALARA